MSTRRVVTWNLWGHFGPWEERWPAIVSTVQELAPDVICLNEVWGDDRSDQAADLAGALGLHHVFRQTGPRSDGTRFGNAILSREAIVDSDHRMLPSAHGQEPRLALRASIQAPNAPLQVYCAHLSWEFEASRLRQQQLAALASFVLERHDPAGAPPIVCGDMNADAWSDEIRMLTGQSVPPVPGLVFQDAWEMAGEGRGLTWDRRNPHLHAPVWPDRRLDYILVGWPRDTKFGTVERCSLGGTNPVDDVQASDHYAVVADLTWGS